MNSPTCEPGLCVNVTEDQFLSTNHLFSSEEGRETTKSLKDAILDVHGRLNVAISLNHRPNFELLDKGNVQ